MPFPNQKGSFYLDNLRIKPYWNPFFPGFSIPKDVDPADLEELKVKSYLFYFAYFHIEYIACYGE